ncbi:MAG: DDE-type integrase/transposase/recombinase [Nanoarchaeota archaeon]
MNEIVIPTINGNIHYDEKYVKVKDDWNFDLNAVDNITKFVLAHSFVGKRTKEECKKFLKQIKDSCYPQILERYLSEKHKPREDRFLFEFICDKFANYKSAFSKLFYRVAELHFGVPIACKRYGLKHNNNPVERYNGKLEDRLKIIRGGFGSFEGAKDFMNLQRVLHNFINPHQELQGKTPSEMAEITLPLKRKKLLNLIRFLAKSRR